MLRIVPDVFDLQLPSGRVRAERTGPADAPLVLCVHGLSASARGFDALVPAIAAGGRQVIAVDLRGRGRSEVTPPGTYGIDSHAADVLAIADQLGAPRVAHAGWSMGAIIGIRVAALAGDRLERLVLLDHAGAMDMSAVDLIRNGLARLDAVTATREQYVDAIRAAGAVSPWTPFWDAYYGYEIVEREDGTWSPSTSRAACTEDLEAVDIDAIHSWWPALQMPVLLVRATIPIGGGLIVPDAELSAFRDAVAGLEVLEADASHYTVMEHPAVVAAVAGFLG
jgi:pimeloyl-ACP methyl ester carboxylesterase